MAVDFSSLVTQLTKAQALEIVMSGFRLLGFKTTSWVAGGIGPTTANFLADLICQSRAVTAEIARGSLLRYAQGGWAVARCESDYDERPTPAAVTVGKMVLTSSAGAPPYTRAARSVWVSNGSLRFVNTEAFTLAAGVGEYVRVGFEAEYAGAAYNLPTDSALQLVTSLPGVTVTNPAYSGGDWITSDGADAQSVSDLVDRCVAKWASRSWQSPAEAYELWAKGASALVTRVSVDAQNPDGPGTLRVYVAGSAGGITDAGVLAAVDAVLQARRSITAIVSVVGTLTQTVYVQGTVQVSGSAISTVQAGVDAALTALFAAIPIGGMVIGEGSGVVPLDSIIAAVRGVAGVVRFAWTAPTQDVEVSANRVPVPNISGLTYEAV